MGFKINSKTRIKIVWQKLRELLNGQGYPYKPVDAHLPNIEKELGLKHTSNRWSTNGYTYYFQIVDYKKFMLARFKYEI